MAELDSAIENYDGAGPLGSTDRRNPIDVDKLCDELNDESSSIRESWTEYQIKEWVKTLGVARDPVTLSIFRMFQSIIITSKPNRTHKMFKSGPTGK